MTTGHLVLSIFSDNEGVRVFCSLLSYFSLWLPLLMQFNEVKVFHQSPLVVRLISVMHSTMLYT